MASPYAINASDAPIVIRRPHGVERESVSLPSDTRADPNSTPKRRVSVANIETNLMNLGKRRRTKSRLEGGGSSLVDGPSTIARNIAEPIQPIAEKICNHTRTALIKLETMGTQTTSSDIWSGPLSTFKIVSGTGPAQI